MEALYSKLCDKYTKLKAKKLSEFDQINKSQEVKFMNFMSAADELTIPGYLLEAYAHEQTEILQRIVSQHSGSGFVFAEEPEAKKELWKVMVPARVHQGRRRKFRLLLPKVHGLPNGGSSFSNNENKRLFGLHHRPFFCPNRQLLALKEITAFYQVS
ncbi:hypothetical protein K1719_003667 [Acacia pycnantha]|nr:hypothetical protein K1719_003667 [Acacia pycnantha]